MLTLEQSKANCVTSFAAMQSTGSAYKTAITDALVHAARHSVVHKCPANLAKIVAYLDEHGQYKELKAVKKFALDFTGVSLKGENPSINDERHTKAQETCEPELERVQELGLIGWYEQATGTGKEKKAPKSKAEKQAAKETKALDTLAEIAKDPEHADSAIMQMVLEYKASLEKVAKYNPSQAHDMHNATIGSLTKAMMGSINQLKASQTPSEGTIPATSTDNGAVVEVAQAS